MAHALEFAPITWEAVATLMAGAGAVTGAVWVFLRQGGILERQVGLEELKVRESTFDRRFAVYEAATAYLAHMNTKASGPPYSIEGPFLEAKRRARFLFGPAVLAFLGEVYDVGTEYHAGVAASASDDPQDRQKAVDEHKRVRAMLRDCLDRIDTVFEAEMGLRRS